MSASSSSANCFTKHCGWTIVRTALSLSLLQATLLWAADATEAPNAAPIDKSQYNLLNPVPASRLREFETDRPNTTNSPLTVDAGHLQLETGLLDYNFNRDHSRGANSRFDTFTIGQMNYRVGVLDNLELNFVIDSYVFTREQNHLTDATSRASGIGDLTIGGKLNLFGNDPADSSAVGTSALAIQPQFKLPSIDNQIGNGFFEFYVGVPYQINLPGEFHLAVQPAVAHLRNTSNTGDVTTFQGAVSIDHVVGDKLDVYVEYVTTFSTEKHSEPVQNFDVGGVYPLNDNLQLDTGFFIGLNHATPVLDVTIGVTVRF